MRELNKLWNEFKSNWQDWNQSRVNHFIYEFSAEFEKAERENAKLKKELEDLEFRFECFKKSPSYKAVELAQKGMVELKKENARMGDVLNRLQAFFGVHRHLYYRDLNGNVYPLDTSEINKILDEQGKEDG